MDHRQRAKQRGSIVWLLSFLGLAARRRADTVLGTLGLSPPEAMFLRAAAATEDGTVLGLAERCGLGGSTAVGVVDRLEEAGLVHRERDTTDRRVVRVRLTPRGQKAVEAVPALAVEMEDEMLEGFSATERESLRGYLLRLVETAQARTPELLEKIRAERMEEWARARAREGRGRERRRAR